MTTVQTPHEARRARASDVSRSPLPKMAAPRRARRLWLALSGACAALAVTPVASADAPTPGDALFNRGLQEMLAGDYEKGCPDLAESYRLAARPGTLFTRAECESKRGHLATAVRLYEQYLAEYPSLPPDSKAKQDEAGRPQKSSAEIGSLKPQAPQIILALPPNAPQGTTIRVDGEVIPRAALSTPYLLDPGEHEILVEAPGGATSSTRVAIAKGETKTAALTVPADATSKPPPAAVAPPEAAPTSMSGRRKAAWVTGGVGAAGLVLGAVTGLLMLPKVSKVNAGCVDGGPGESICKTQGEVDAGNGAKTLGTVSTVGWAVAVAGLGTAAVLFLTEPTAAMPATPAKVGKAPSKRGEAARLGVGIVGADATGLKLGIQGTF